jgi:hypothetical protein
MLGNIKYISDFFSSLALFCANLPSFVEISNESFYTDIPTIHALMFEIFLSCTIL